MRTIRRPALPFSGLGHFADLAADQIALQCRDVTDVEPPKQMIGFMLERAREQLFAGLLEDFAFQVVGAYRDAAAARHVLAEAGDAQAAFLALLLAFHVNDFGIDQYDLLRRI